MGGRSVVALRKTNGMNIGGRAIQVLSWGPGFQYLGSPIIHDGGLDGQTLVGHEGVANEDDLVLSPSECREKVGKITIARDEDDGGWG